MNFYRLKSLAGTAALAACLCVSNSVFAADDAWAAARDSIASLNWSNALSQYTDLRNASTQGSTKWVEATFCQAVAQQHVQPASAETMASAVKLFQEVIDNGKDDHFVARSIMNLGRIAELRDFPDDPIDMDGARKFYEQVMQRWPNQPIGSEAALRAGATLVMTYDTPDFVKVKQGIALLEQWLASHPKNPYANIMWQYAGDSYFRPLGDYANALRCYDKVEQLGWADAGNQGAWYWRCAQMAERYLHNRDRAIYYYTQLIVKTPTYASAYAAYEELKKMNAPLPSAAFLNGPAEGKTP